MLAKVNPTSKACQKFLINVQLEFKLDLIPELINVLRNYLTTPVAQQGFVIVAQYENWRKENIRLVVRTSSFGGYEILQQKRIEVLEDEDMEFSDDPAVVDTAELAKPEEEWADMFGALFIKKNDNIADIVKGLNEFYSNTGIGAPAKEKKYEKKGR